MTLIEAIKSELPFRRKDWKYAAFITPRKNGVGMQLLEIDYDSICADDWELEQPEVTINMSIFEAVAIRSINKLPKDGYLEEYGYLLCNLIKEDIFK